MGAPKLKWTAEEEEALRAGIAKHGAGKWRTIQKDPDFAQLLAARSNIDLKDKWRNLNVSGQAGAKERPKTPSSMPLAIVNPPSMPLPVISPTPLSIVVDAPQIEAPKIAVPDAGVNQPKAPTLPKYNALIIEALTVFKDPSGADIGSICRYIENQMEVPPNFRRQLSAKLRRLVAQDKIVKTYNGYVLKSHLFMNQTPPPKQRDPPRHLKPSQTHGQDQSATLFNEAAVNAAYRIADAEAKSLLALEAVKESERVSRMAEEADSVLQMAKEIFERCLRGEIITMALSC